MSILQFVPQRILENLDADPRRAFLQIVSEAQSHYSKTIKENSFAGTIASLYFKKSVENERKKFRLEFASVILSSARKLNIERLSHIDVYDINRFYDSGKFDDFMNMLNECVTDLYLDLQMENYDTSVVLSQRSKDDITNYVNALKDCVSNANISDSKKKSLLKKLDEFEEELVKKRVNIAAVTIVALEILALPGGVWASYEVANKLIVNIVQTVAEARATNQEMRELSAPESYRALPPPASEKPQRT